MSDTEDLLALLNAHGQQFMSCFGSTDGQQPKGKKRKLSHSPGPSKHSDNSIYEEVSEQEGSEGEWDGISNASTSSGMVDADNEKGMHSMDEDSGTPVVVFADPSSSKGKQKQISGALKKQFMSPKVSKLREDVIETTRSTTTQSDDEGSDGELSNAKNDALLHRLVHTRLLSGSLNSELNLTRGQRQKALQGRLLELANEAKLGKGDTVVRHEEQNKASKRVRLGLEQKMKERQEKSLDEAKQLGNYHHSIKYLFEDTSIASKQPKKRERGLRLGVGKFSGGTLKLARHEIESVQGSRLPSMSGRGRGGKGGKSKRT